MEAVARSLGGLVAVLALVWFLARMLRGRTGPARGAQLRVSQRVGLGRRSGVAVVEAGGRRLLVGVGDAQVTFLADLGSGDTPDAGGHGLDTDLDVAPEPPRPSRPHGIVVRELGGSTVPAPRGGLRDLVVRAQERTVRR